MASLQRAGSDVIAIFAGNFGGQMLDCLSIAGFEQRNWVFLRDLPNGHLAASGCNKHLLVDPKGMLDFLLVHSCIVLLDLRPLTNKDIASRALQQ